MKLKTLVIILCLTVPWTLCNPLNSNGQDSESQQSLSSKEEDEIEISARNSTFLTPEKDPVFAVENPEFALVKQTLPLGEEKDSGDDQENWIAPLYIRKTFPYVISGFDDSSRPIYIIQVGKMDLRSVVDRGAEAQEAALKYILQMNDLVKKYLKQLKTEDGKSVTQNIVILDFDGLTLRQFTPKNLAFLLKVTQEMRNFVEQYVSEVYVVNVNFVAEQLIQLSRPVWGEILERFTLLGTNPQKWRPIIRRTFGPQNVPEYYGGNPDWKPVKYYGAR